MAIFYQCIGTINHFPENKLLPHTLICALVIGLRGWHGRPLFNVPSTWHLRDFVNAVDVDTSHQRQADRPLAGHELSEDDDTHEAIAK
jgi:hypothetical protein